MTNPITQDTPFVTESSIHHFTCFASDVEQFRKGFPPRVETTLGNGQPFVGWKRNVKDGDLQYVVYKQALGCITLQVFND
jgi:hypothetical protein